MSNAESVGSVSGPSRRNNLANNAQSSIRKSGMRLLFDRVENTDGSMSDCDHLLIMRVLTLINLATTRS